MGAVFADDEMRLNRRGQATAGNYLLKGWVSTIRLCPAGTAGGWGCILRLNNNGEANYMPVLKFR